MLPINVEYVVGENQERKAVLLPLADWARIVEELEELDEIRACDEAKAGPQEAIPFDQAVREIEEGFH